MSLCLPDLPLQTYGAQWSPITGKPFSYSGMKLGGHKIDNVTVFGTGFRSSNRSDTRQQLFHHLTTTTMSMLESLPVELISDILSETDIASLIIVSCLSRRLRYITSDPALNPWRRPILRNLISGAYEKPLNTLSVHSTVPRQNWIEINSLACASYLLFEATLPNLKESEWEESFRRRFLPSWAKKKDSTWRSMFHKTLYRVWHRTHSSCTTDESWTKYIMLNRNSTANQFESASRTFSPLAIFNEFKLQNNLLQYETRVRLVVRFADVRILALGVLNAPKSSFSVNENAWFLLHPPRLQLLDSAKYPQSQNRPSISGDQVSQHTFDSLAPSRLRHPTPAMSHMNYPMYTPGGQDRRWVQPDEMESSNLKWVGGMMLTAQLVGPHTMENWSDSPALEDADLIVGPGRNQYASLCWEDLMAIAPWMDEIITKKMDEAGLGH